jgi:hypothetical protein
VNHAVHTLGTKAVGERRKHDRFQINGMSFVYLGPSFNIEGKILNISKAGLAFRYMTKDWRLIESKTLNIVLLDGTWRLRNVPFEVIWDFSISYDFSFGKVTFGQCGVEFGELTHLQKSDLEDFIRYYTTPPFSKKIEGKIHDHDLAIRRLPATLLRQMAWRPDLSKEPYVPTH